jgi:predicted short-subunit dehydrogenase-like oxidoreductase (DUF2520 family)
MFAICLQSLSLLAQAIRGTEIQARTDLEASKDHLQAVSDLKANYFDIYRVSKGLILKPSMKEYFAFI